MARNVLFLIHGIGNHGPGWSEKSQQVLSAEFERYMMHAGKNVSLSDSLEFVELPYNGIFVNIWKRWSELSTRLDLLDGQPQFLEQTVDLLGDASTSGSQIGNNRKVDYAGDALLYRSLGLVRRLVLLQIMSEMAGIIADRMASDIRTEFGVLGHSMGTAVAHDALHILGTTNWTQQSWDAGVSKTLTESEAALSSPSGNLRRAEKELLDGVEQKARFSGLSAGMFQFKSIFMVANTCRSLACESDPYRSIVRPRPHPGSHGIAGFADWFVNVSHVYDPVAQIRKLDTARLNDPPGSALDINVSHLYSDDVHALDHYLLNPKVHREVFGTMCPGSFGIAERDYANRRFDEQLEAEGNPDYFKRRGGDFSDTAVASRMREFTTKHFSDLLEKLV